MHILRSALIIAIFLPGILGATISRAQAPTTTNIVKAVILTRTGERFSQTDKSGKVYIGKRGILQVGKSVYHTIERVGVVSLKKGTYEIIMEQQHNSDGSEKRKVFRVQTEGSLGHKLKGSSGGPAAILIHVANYPDQLTGCVAPGLTKTAEGIDGSTHALKAIFEACGGFVDGKKVVLVVRN